MRTTVTLDSDTEAIVRRRMAERGVGFKQALNDVIRESAIVAKGRSRPFRTPAFDLGRPTVNLDRALQLHGALEDEELIRKMRRSK